MKGHSNFYIKLGIVKQTALLRIVFRSVKTDTSSQIYSCEGHFKILLKSENVSGVIFYRSTLCKINDYAVGTSPGRQQCSFIKILIHMKFTLNNLSRFLKVFFPAMQAKQVS